MATGNPFSNAQAPAYNLIAPDLAADQMKLTRQQQMADMLRQQALAPDQGTQVINGWAVKKSPLEGLAKILQGGLAGYTQQQGDEKQAALSKALSGRVGSLFQAPSAPQSQQAGDAPAPVTDAVSGLQQAPEQGAPPPQAPQQPMQQGLAQQPAPQQAPQGIAPQAPQQSAGGSLLIPGMDPQTAQLAYTQDPNGYLAALLKRYDATDMQKNDKYLGIDAAQSRQAELAKRLKDGTMSLQPGQTNVLPNGQRMVAPNFETGVAGGFDAQGNPVANQIQGSTDIAAQRAGAIAAATGAANAQNELVTLNLPSGPVQVTKAQATQMANGGGQPAQQQAPSGPPNQGFPAGAQVPAPTPGGNSRQAILQQEMQAIQARPDSDPRKAADLAAITRELGGAAAPATRAPGIALQDQGSSSFETSMGSKSADKLLESRDTARAANDQLVSIAESRKAIKAGAYQGFGSDMKTDAVKMAQGFGIPLDSDKMSNSEYLRSTLAAGILANAKKLGTNPTEGDTRLLGQILGGLGKDPQAMSKLLDLQEKMANRTIDMHNSDIKSATDGGAKFPFDLGVKKYSDAAAPAVSKPAASNKTFDAPPAAAQFAGKRMRAPDGSILRSDGKNWVKE